MKKLAIIVCFTLAACGVKEDLRIDPGPPKDLEIIQEKVPVPVLCTVTVTRPALEIDSLPEGEDLEVQNAALRASIAQQETFITDLVAGIIGCGGTVVDSRKAAKPAE